MFSGDRAIRSRPTRRPAAPFCSPLCGILSLPIISVVSPLYCARAHILIPNSTSTGRAQCTDRSDLYSARAPVPPSSSLPLFHADRPTCPLAPPPPPIDSLSPSFLSFQMWFRARRCRPRGSSRRPRRRAPSSPRAGPRSSSARRSVSKESTNTQGGVRAGVGAHRYCLGLLRLQMHSNDCIASYSS